MCLNVTFTRFTCWCYIGYKLIVTSYFYTFYLLILCSVTCYDTLHINAEEKMKGTQVSCKSNYTLEGYNMHHNLYFKHYVMQPKKR